MKQLDLGCGATKRQGMVGMDIRPLPGVDIVHDAEVLPWPIPDETFDEIVAWHIFEHLKPWLILGIVDECWRIAKPDGRLIIGMPMPGSFGFFQDPTHIRTWNEATPFHFDPDHELYAKYRPKPWKIETNGWYSKPVPKGVTERAFNACLHIVLKKREEVF